MIEAVVAPETTVLISFARTKVDAAATIIDAQALADVQRALGNFLAHK